MTRPLLVLAALLAACSTSAGGPEYIELGINAVEDAGEVYPQVCTPMPIMPGGHTRHEVPFGDAFSATVDATRDRVEVTFQGINVPETVNRTLPRETLENGYAATDVRVETLDGRRFTLRLVSPCDQASVP